MAQLSSKLRSASDGGLLFRCPGCEENHKVMIGAGPGPRWAFDGDFDCPTFQPSIWVTWKTPSDVPEEFDDETQDIKHVCHSFVEQGQIRFLDDCTHELAGQTVALPDMQP